MTTKITITESSASNFSFPLFFVLAIGLVFYLFSSGLLAVTDDGIELKFRQKNKDGPIVAQPKIDVPVKKANQPTISKEKTVPPIVKDILVEDQAPVDQIEPITTIFTSSDIWTNENGWKIYQSPKMNGCYAESKQVDGSILLLGLVGKNNDLIIAISSSKFDKSLRYKFLTHTFDNGRKIVPFVHHQTFGVHNLVAGNYGNLKWLKELLASSNSFSLSDSGLKLAQISLKGSRKAFDALIECNKVIQSNNSNSVAVLNERLLNERLCANKPSHGKILKQRRNFSKSGHKLTIKNGSNGDAIIVIRKQKNKKLIYSFLVSQSKTKTISGIRDGKYIVQYATGNLYKPNCETFWNPVAKQFDKTLNYWTSKKRTKKQIITTSRQWTFTLYPVVGGDATSTNIAASEFNKD